MQDGILFDLDGTLWDAALPITKAWNIVLRRRNFPPLTLAQLSSYLGKTPEEIAALMLPSLPQSERMRVMDECFQEENDYLSQHGGRLYPHLEETLSLLSQRFGLYIVSNCSHGYIETFWNYHRLKPYFLDMEYAGRTGKSKGQNIRLLMNRNSVRRAVYVGDTLGDLQAAQEARIPFIHAAYGFGSVPPGSPSISSICSLPDVVDMVLGMEK